MIKKIDHTTAREFIEKWHYSHVCPTGKNIFFGWYDGDLLYAVADYGIGVNPFQVSFLSRELNKDVCNLLELKRLCRIEPKNEKMPLTKFISGCHRILRQEGYEYIISFSDPHYGHNGGIYKASNFRHMGKTNPERHAVDAEGNIKHRRFYYRYARRNGLTMKQARDELGLKVLKMEPKDRWLIYIGYDKSTKI